MIVRGNIVTYFHLIGYPIMCTCNYCLFSTVIKKLNIKEAHPEQYNLIDESFIIIDSLNTDTCMLSINCQHRLEGKTNKTPSEITGEEGSRDFLTKAANQHDDFLIELNQAAENTALPEVVRQAIRYCAINVELEINVVRDVLDILNADKSQQHKMDEIITLIDDRPSRNTELTKTLHELIAMQKALEDPESVPVPPSLVVKMDSTKSEGEADIKKFVILPTLRLVDSVFAASRFLRLYREMVSIEVKLDAGIFLGSYYGDVEGEFELSNYSDEQLARMTANKEFEIDKLKVEVHNQKITVFADYAIISCGSCSDEIDTCLSEKIETKVFARLHKELKYFC